MSELAEAYSRTGAAWQAGPALVYDPMADALVATSPVPLAGRTIIDLGAGTGAASRAIAAAGGRPVAADLALGMLRALPDLELPKIVSDARALPFARRSIGGLVAAFCLNHLPDPHVALAEAGHAVSPGGPILASAYAQDDTHPVKAAVEAAATEQGWVPDPWVGALRAGSMPILATVDSATAVCERAGLRHYTVRKVDVPLPHLDRAQLVAWRCGMAQMAPFVATLPPADQRRLRERALELLGDAPALVRRMIVVAAVV